MPLLPDLSLEGFVQVDVVNVASEANNVTRTPNTMDIAVELEDQFDSVIGVEIENYHIPIATFSQFQDADKIDFRLQNAAINAGVAKDFTAVVAKQPVVYNSPTWAAGDLLTNLNNAFEGAILRDPDFGGIVSIIPIVDEQKLTTLICRTLSTGLALNSTQCTFLFSSGPNKATSAATVLGFDDSSDFVFTDYVVGPYTFKYAQSLYPASINRFRYLDVFVQETPELDPLYRIFLPTIRSVATALPENNSRVRLLTEPVKKLKTLHVNFRLEGGIVPVFRQPFYFSLRIYQLRSAIVEPQAAIKKREKLV